MLFSGARRGSYLAGSRCRLLGSTLQSLPWLGSNAGCTGYVDTATGRLSATPTMTSLVCHLVSPAKTAEAIEKPFALRTRVGPGKHLLHNSDRFGRILYCVYSTQYSLLV